MINVCNICGKEGPLTLDHVPPQSCLSYSNLEVYSVIRLYGDSKDQKRKHKYKPYQNGTYFKTLCGSCNSLLGTKYDVEWKKFVDGVRSFFDSSIYLPIQINLLCRPQRLMKSVVGHSMAMSNNGYVDSPRYKLLTQYVLDEDSVLPDHVNIYYWLYPYPSQTLIKGFGVVDFKTHSKIIGHLIKFFPIAFLVTYGQYEGKPLGICDLEPYRMATIHEEVDVPILLYPLQDERWPESPRDHTAVLLNEQNSILGRPKPNKKAR